MNSGFRRSSPGVLNATNVSVRFLVQFAYDLREDQVSGGPSWIDTARYEVMAKPEPGADQREAGRMIKARTQTLLADRFRLTFHRETKEMPVLALTPARNGPKGLKPSTDGQMDFVNNGHHLSAQHLSMAIFASQFLANQTRRSVMDKTGIEGNFDFTLDWTPDDAPATGADGSLATPEFPALFKALEEQLGLKLEPAKGPVEVMIIDHVERPAGN